MIHPRSYFLVKMLISMMDLCSLIFLSLYIKVYQSARRILVSCYMIYNNIATKDMLCDGKSLQICTTDFKFELEHASFVRT